MGFRCDCLLFFLKAPRGGGSIRSGADVTEDSPCTAEKTLPEGPLVVDVADTDV